MYCTYRPQCPNSLMPNLRVEYVHMYVFYAAGFFHFGFSLVQTIIYNARTPYPNSYDIILHAFFFFFFFLQITY